MTGLCLRSTTSRSSLPLIDLSSSLARSGSLACLRSRTWRLRAGKPTATTVAVVDAVDAAIALAGGEACSSAAVAIRSRPPGLDHTTAAAIEDGANATRGLSITMQTTVRPSRMEVTTNTEPLSHPTGTVVVAEVVADQAASTAVRHIVEVLLDTVVLQLHPATEVEVVTAVTAAARLKAMAVYLKEDMVALHPRETITAGTVATLHPLEATAEAIPIRVVVHREVAADDFRLHN
jgi:hypothetical protein